jgi:beta-lactam-binding protein with PASTA domain
MSKVLGLAVISAVVSGVGCAGHSEPPQPKLVRVPDVVGLPEEAAFYRLADAGLCVHHIEGAAGGSGSVVELPRKRLYRVLKQSLRPGSRVHFHRHVSLVVVRPGGVDETDTYIDCPRTFLTLRSTVGGDSTESEPQGNP